MLIININKKNKVSVSKTQIQLDHQISLARNFKNKHVEFKNKNINTLSEYTLDLGRKT